MFSPEGSSWSKTETFLRRFGVRVDPNSKGVDNFNQLECESSDSSLVLKRRIEKVAVTTSLSFVSQSEQGIITASAMLEAESLDQLNELLRKEAYVAYRPKGRVEIGQITHLMLRTNTLILVPISKRKQTGVINRMIFTFETGALTSIARRIFRPSEESFLSSSRFRYTI